MIIYVNCGFKNEDVSEHRSYEHYLNRGENKATLQIYDLFILFTNFAKDNLAGEISQN